MNEKSANFGENLQSIVEIDGRAVGKGEPPYIIAEMSANHCNDIEIAKEIVRSAKRCGADAVKIQTYRPDTITLDSEKEHFKAKGAWEGIYLYDLYTEAFMPWEWTGELQAVAREEGITLFSSPFDYSAVDFLESLGMPAYKIASPEIVDLPLISHIAKTGKPVILSTGNATLGQISEAVETILKAGNDRIAILKCTSEYPAPPEEINLKTIPSLQDLFGCPVGLSDHTLGTAVPVASIGVGANIIEKHFLLSKTHESADSFFSADPEELRAIAEGAQLVHQALGKVSFPLVKKPDQRSLIAVADIEEGERLVEGKNFRSIRPGGGIASKDLALVQNRKASRFIERGSLLTWDMIGGA